VLVELGSSTPLTAHVLARAIDAESLPGIEDVVIGSGSVLVEFDPLLLDATVLCRRLRELVDAAPRETSTTVRLRSVPVVYGGEYGPDLEAIAARLQLPQAKVTALHRDGAYVVEMMGFAPGFPYLEGLPPVLELPRRETPRERVPAGSVAIAGLRSGIYPSSTPGGWHLIGRTPIVLFDASRTPPAYLAPGDRVHFVEIAAADFERYAGAPADW
jgi:KipI family sensor histidine kinase inhibitor